MTDKHYEVGLYRRYVAGEGIGPGATHWYEYDRDEQAERDVRLACDILLTVMNHQQMIINELLIRMGWPDLVELNDEVHDAMEAADAMHD
jgi:hypothetical protein